MPFRLPQSIIIVLMQKGPRTSRQEAEELSSVIQQATETFDNFREKQLRRQVPCDISL